MTIYRMNYYNILVTSILVKKMGKTFYVSQSPSDPFLQVTSEIITCSCHLVLPSPR